MGKEVAAPDWAVAAEERHALNIMSAAVTMARRGRQWRSSPIFASLQFFFGTNAPRRDAPTEFEIQFF
jgi:hypothetical protein